MILHQPPPMLMPMPALKLNMSVMSQKNEENSLGFQEFDTPVILPQQPRNYPGTSEKPDFGRADGYF